MSRDPIRGARWHQNLISYIIGSGMANASVYNDFADWIDAHDFSENNAFSPRLCHLCCLTELPPAVSVAGTSLGQVDATHIVGRWSFLRNQTKPSYRKYAIEPMQIGMPWGSSIIVGFRSAASRASSFGFLMIIHSLRISRRLA